MISHENVPLVDVAGPSFERNSAIFSITVERITSSEHD